MSELRKISNVRSHALDVIKKNLCEQKEAEKYPFALRETFTRMVIGLKNQNEQK